MSPVDPPTMLSRPGQNRDDGVMATPDVGVLMLMPVAAAIDSILDRSLLISGRELGRDVATAAKFDGRKAATGGAPFEEGTGEPDRPARWTMEPAGLLDADMLRFSGAGQWSLSLIDGYEPFIG